MYCHAYLTMQIICSGFGMILDVEPIYDLTKLKNNGNNGASNASNKSGKIGDTSKANYEEIGKLMMKMMNRAKRMHLKIKNVYVDRGFYRGEVLEKLGKTLSKRLVMPAVRSPMVKRTIREWYTKNGYQEGSQEVKLKSSDGKHQESYMLIFKAKSLQEREEWREKAKIDVDDKSLEIIDKDFWYFCVTEPPRSGNTLSEVFDQVALEYGRRWGIETGYRVSKSVWAWTTSTSYQLRFWLMWNSILIYNLWVLENLKFLDDDVFGERSRKRKSREELLQEIKTQYNCCSFPTLQEVEEAKKRKEWSKLPIAKRSTAEFPLQPFKPGPKLKIRSFSTLILLIAGELINKWYDLDDELKQGYDPPKAGRSEGISEPSEP